MFIYRTVFLTTGELTRRIQCLNVQAGDLCKLVRFSGVDELDGAAELLPILGLNLVHMRLTRNDVGRDAADVVSSKFGGVIEPRTWGDLVSLICLRCRGRRVQALHTRRAELLANRNRLHAATIVEAHPPQKPRRTRAQLRPIRISTHLGIPRNPPPLRQPRRTRPRNPNHRTSHEPTTLQRTTVYTRSRPNRPLHPPMGHHQIPHAGRRPRRLRSNLQHHPKRTRPQKRSG